MYQSYDFDYILKFVMVGDSSVGKSSLLSRYVDNQFHEQNFPTIGVDFKIKNFSFYNEKQQKKDVKLSIWDTAGQERFKSIVRTYYKGVQGIILVYDITCRESFNDLKQWLEEIQNYQVGNPDILIIGNKNDLLGERQVSFFEGKEFVEDIGLNCLFIETSCKNDENVEEAFQSLCLQLIKKIDKNRNISMKDKEKIRIEINKDLRKNKKENTCC